MKNSKYRSRKSAKRASKSRRQRPAPGRVYSMAVLTDTHGNRFIPYKLKKLLLSDVPR